MSEDAKKELKEELAEERTHWAEDRTLLANERTFAGWVRTGMGAVGIGIGFNALFGQLEPGWLARALASVFILIGAGIFITAERRANATRQRLSRHSAKPISRAWMQTVSLVLTAAALALIAGIWLTSRLG